MNIGTNKMTAKKHGRTGKRDFSLAKKKSVNRKRIQDVIILITVRDQNLYLMKITQLKYRVYWKNVDVCWLSVIFFLRPQVTHCTELLLIHVHTL
jgi:hypothetical protein